MGYYKQQMIDSLDSYELKEPDPITREQMEYELAEYDIEHMSTNEVRELAIGALKEGYGRYSNHDLMVRYEDLFNAL